MGYIWERPESRPFRLAERDAEITLSFTVVEAQHEFEVQELATSLAPPVYDGLVRKELTVEALPGFVWRANWRYGALDPQQSYDPGEIGGANPDEKPPPTAPAPADALGPSFSCEVGGGTAHITQSRQTLETSPGAPNYQKAIGHTRDRVEGTDIVVPQMTWQRQVTRGKVTLAYLKTIFDLTGTVNDNTTFYGFNRGELLYLGASCEGGTGGVWTLTHKFSFSPTEYNVDVGVEDPPGTPVLVPFKRGWEYLWVSYKEDADENVLLQKPWNWYREQVYRMADWTPLEIGV